MKKYLPTAMLVGLVVSFPGWAINVGEITSIMTSAESSLSKEITNTTDAARYVSVSVKQLSSPLAGGVEIKPVNSGELLSTPANLILLVRRRMYFAFSIKDQQMMLSVIIVCNGLMNRLPRARKPGPIKWRLQQRRLKLELFWWLRRERSVLNITEMAMLLPILAMFRFSDRLWHV